MIGTRARRIASRPLRPTLTSSSSPGCSMISLAAKRTAFELRGPARPRSLVIRTISRLPSSRRLSSGCSSPPRTAARSARISSSSVRVGPSGQGRLLGAAQLRGSHELHRPGDLPDVPRRGDAPADVSLARHAALPPPSQECAAELVGRRFEGRGRIVVEHLGRGELLHHVGCAACRGSA